MSVNTSPSIPVPPVAAADARASLAGKANEPAQPKAWKEYQKILFRVAFIFFICISIPNSLEWYKQLIHLNWLHLHYRDLYDIARFGSGINLFGNAIFGNALLGYANWIITGLVSIGGGLIWMAVVKLRKTERHEYRTLYYWLRVVVRYRAGIGIIGFGFTKVLPTQLPYPSLGVLNTNFGDLTAQKIYWLSIGIVPWYEVFAGVVEVLAGVLLFFRRTTTLGAILLFGALSDIVYVNFAYDGGVHVYSSYFVLLAAFLLVQDTPAIYRLFIKEKYTVPHNWYPSLQLPWQKGLRMGLKSLTIFLFLIVLFYLQLVNFLYDPYKQPAVAGVKTLRGNYHVTEFRINDRVIPYSPLDPVRWQEATFENWSTLTFRVNKPTPLDLSNGGGDPQRDVNRTFEVSGVAGGQRVFHYYADEVNKVLYLEDKYKAIPDRRNRTAGAGDDGGAGQNLNPQGTRANQAGLVNPHRKKQKEEFWIPEQALVNIGEEVNKIDKLGLSVRRTREYAAAPKNEQRNRMTLHYQTTDGNRVILTGTGEHRDSIRIVLDRYNRNYTLSESKLQAGKYD